MINNCKLTIIIAVFTISFIGYNILTVDADEEYDKKVCEDYNGEWKDTGGGDRGCKFEDTDDAERYGYRPGFSLSGTHGDAEYGIEDLVSYEEGNKVYPKIPEYLLEEKESPKQICEHTSGEWKDGTCNFSKEEREYGYQEDFDHSMEEEGLWDNYALEQQSKKEAAQERKKMTQSKTFKNLLESKGIDYDDYDNLSAEKQEEIETEFKEDKSDEYGEELKNKEEEDEGKRYVNPDGGAPLYEDELTEDEKDYYEEYKPEKEEEPPVIYDWGNEVKFEDEEEKIQNELKEITPEEAEEMNEQNQVSEQEEEEDEPKEEEDDNSDSESEE